MSRRLAPLILLLAGCGGGETYPVIDFPIHDLYRGPRDFAGVDFSLPDMAEPDTDGGSTTDLATPRLPDLRHVPDLGCGACVTPPSDVCQTNIQIRYSRNGTCMAGMCNYTSTMTPCMYGCFQGLCNQSGLSFLGNTAAVETGTANVVIINGGTADSRNSVSVTTQTSPPGAVSSVKLVYTNDGVNQQLLVLKYDKLVGNNDQWYAVIPAQLAGTTVFFYIQADGYGAPSLSDPGNFQNYTYTCL